MAVFLFLGFLIPIFLIQRRLLDKNGKFQNRRSVTGAEAARLVFDASGLKQTTVDCLEGGGGGFRSGLGHLHLNRKLYQGKTLLDIAESAWLAVLKTKAPHTLFWLPLDFKGKLWEVNRIVILTGWIFVLLGLCIPHAAIFKTLGLAAFLYVFGLEILDLPTRWETGDYALFLLRHSGHFDADELARLKALMRGLRLQGLAQFFAVPGQLTAKGSPKKGLAPFEDPF